MVRCEFCLYDVPGISRYTVGGYSGLMVCPACYGRILAHERQPYSSVTRRVYQLLGLRPAAMVARAFKEGGAR